eukprot:gene15454-21540_t
MDWAGPSTSSAFGAGNVSNAPNAITTGANLAPMPRFRHKKSASDTFAWATASYLEADPFDLLNSSDVRPPELGGQNPWEMPSTVHNAHRRGSSGVPGISVMPGDFAKRNSSDGIKLECGNASLLQWGATASVSGFGAGADVKSAHPGHRRGISLDGEPHTGFSKTMKDGLATEKPLPNFATQTRANAFDPSQLDPKRAKRIIANRQSAHRSRVKKLQLVHAMEGEIELLAKESKMLEDENIRLEDVQKELHRSARLLHQEVVQKTRQAAQKQELQTAIRKELAQLTQMMSKHGTLPEEKILMDFAGGIDMDSPSSSLGLPRLMSPATTRPEVGFDDGGLQNSLMPIAEIPESPTLDLRNQEALAMDVGSLVPGALNMNLSLLSADQEMLRSLLSIPSGDDMPGLPFS